MSDTVTPCSYSTLLRYNLATPTQQTQALAYACKRLQPQFAAFSTEEWVRALTTFNPTLWLDKDTSEAFVEDGSLEAFANWLDGSRVLESDDTVTLYGHEALYLARNVSAWCQLAANLVEVDPGLATAESIGQMRSLFRRLSVGNAVAERICQVFVPLTSEIETH